MPPTLYRISVLETLDRAHPVTTAPGSERGNERGAFDNGANREVLFDLVNDPGELKPVTYDPAYRKQLLAHRNMLLDWDAKISDEDFSPRDKFPELPKEGP